MEKKKEFRTVKVQFREVATARLHSATPLTTDEVVLLPVYIGRRASGVRIEDTYSLKWIRLGWWSPYYSAWRRRWWSSTPPEPPRGTGKDKVSIWWYKLQRRILKIW